MTDPSGYVRETGNMIDSVGLSVSVDDPKKETGGTSFIVLSIGLYTHELELSMTNDELRTFITELSNAVEESVRRESDYVQEVSNDD